MYALLGLIALIQMSWLVLVCSSVFGIWMDLKIAAPNLTLQGASLHGLQSPPVAPKATRTNRICTSWQGAAGREGAA